MRARQYGHNYPSTSGIRKGIESQASESQELALSLRLESGKELKVRRGGPSGQGREVAGIRKGIESYQHRQLHLLLMWLESGKELKVLA